MSVATLAINWTEQGLVPDSVIRAGIRRLLKQRLAEIRADDADPQERRQHERVRNCSPLREPPNLCQLRL